MRWRAFPRSLDPRARELVAELRRLKDHSGLSLKSLEAKAPFSKSSWQRFLNGEALPPPAAVEALARVADADATPLLRLRDAAAKTWAAHRAESNEAGSATQEPAIRVLALSGIAGALLICAVASLLLVVDPWREQGQRNGPAGVGRYPCVYVRHGDQLFAGNSSTATLLVMRNTTGPAAAEVQCLLLRHRLSPGDVDGYFGERTETEVKRLQRRDNVPADGVVGEQTWALLRHAE